MKNTQLALLFAISAITALALAVFWPGMESQSEVRIVALELHSDSSSSQPPKRALPSAPFSREPFAKAQGVADAKNTREQVAPQLGDAVATLDNGALFVDGLPFSHLDVEAMELTDLTRLKRGLGIVFRKIRADFLAANSVESMFISNDLYMTNRMWHEDLLLWSVQRPSLDSDGKEIQEWGYLNVARGMCDDGFTLKDAVMRIHKAPAFAEYLRTSGEEYQQEQSAKHPNVIWHITEDLALWIGQSPDGSLVGWKSVPTVQDM